MDWSKVHRKLAGRFRLLERRNEDGDCVIHCFGSLGQTGVNNDDVRYICGFYSLPIERTGAEKKPAMPATVFIS